MDHLENLIFLESVATHKLKTICKIFGYINWVLFGFIAVVGHLYGVSRQMLHSSFPSLRKFFYAMGTIYEVWGFNRAVFGYAAVKGAKEDTAAFILPLILDTGTSTFSYLTYIFLLPLSEELNRPYSVRTIVEIVFSLLFDVSTLYFVLNYFRRLRRGNLEAESEQMSS